MGTLQVGKHEFPLHSATWGPTFEPLTNVTSIGDAVTAVRSLRAALERSRLRTETAIMQAKDGSYWASTPLNTYWKHETPWWFPTGEGMSKHRKDTDQTIDAATLFGGAKATVTSLHTDLRAIVGDRFAAIFDGPSNGTTAAATRLR